MWRLFKSTVVTDGKVSLKHRLIGHQKPVSSIAWSPEDDQILTCGIEEVVRRWDVTSGECLRVYEKGLLGLVSCSWSPDGKCVFSGLTDKSIIIMWDMDGKEMECLKGQKTIRISDLQITSDGKFIISIWKETSWILLTDRESRSERCIEEEQMIVSFTLSRDNKYLLLIETLEGHSGAVDCTSWNPVNPHMLASASDDRSIRIWGLKQLHSKQKGQQWYSLLQWSNSLNNLSSLIVNT
ncbi:putative transcription factor WD40-like family [Helianthus anomalus]